MTQVVHCLTGIVNVVESCLEQLGPFARPCFPNKLLQAEQNAVEIWNEGFSISIGGESPRSPSIFSLDSTKILSYEKLQHIHHLGHRNTVSRLCGSTVPSLHHSHCLWPEAVLRESLYPKLISFFSCTLQFLHRLYRERNHSSHLFTATFAASVLLCRNIS